MTEVEAPRFLTDAGFGPLRTVEWKELWANTSSVTRHMNEIQPGEIWAHSRGCPLLCNDQNLKRGVEQNFLHSAALFAGCKPEK